jgi:hypothetical protein
MAKKTNYIPWIIFGAIILALAVFYFSSVQPQISSSNNPNQYQIYYSNATKYSISNLTNENLCNFILQSVGNNSGYCYNVERDISSILDYNCQATVPNTWKCNLNYYNNPPAYVLLSKSGASYYVSRI